jgi:hypothetical protein
MAYIEIYEVVESSMDMVDLLGHIATKIKEGYTSGVKPTWTLFGATGSSIGEDLQAKNGAPGAVKT